MPNNLPQKTPTPLANDADEYIVVASEMVDEATEAVRERPRRLAHTSEEIRHPERRDG